MVRAKIGIQGELGSTNERAARLFAECRNLAEYEIVPLRTTLRVLQALSNGEIFLGTFAWETSRAGLVAETQEVVDKFTYEIIDQLTLPLSHAILKPRDTVIEHDADIRIYSHPQALLEHGEFLNDFFSCCTLIPEEDTALAARKLAQGEYPKNSVVIADRTCIELYRLEGVLLDLPSNEDYWVRIYVVAAKGSDFEIGS